MLLQQSPFRGEDEDEIYDAILADEPLYPIHMPRDSVSILQKLLTREPDQRLGSGPTDAQEIMSQPFFRNINWDDVYHKRLPSPYLPQITSATDTSNFDSEFTVSLGVLLYFLRIAANLITERDPCFDASAKRAISSYARRIPRLLLFCRLRMSALFAWVIAKMKGDAGYQLFGAFFDIPPVVSVLGVLGAFLMPRSNWLGLLV